MWVPSPIGHSTGLNFGVRLALYFGMKLVLQDRWDADRAVELIERERCSYTLAATTFLTDLVAAAERSDRDVSSLTRFGCGGAPVPPEIVRAGADAGINVLRIYGLTEALVVSWNRAGSPLEQAHAHRRAGAARGGARDPRTGEVMVRGPNVCVGLFDDPERERSIFTDDGWLHTGDAGVLDDEGYLSIVGRKKEIIIRGGLNIAPREIEDLLMRDARSARGGGDRRARRAARRDRVRVPGRRRRSEPLDLDDGRRLSPVPRPRDLQASRRLLRIVPELPPRRRARSARTSSASSILGGRPVDARPV